MNLELIQEKVIETFKKIGFTDNYKNISVSHDDFENAMSRMNKNENLKILRSFGYPFKISSPGQLYLFEEEYGHFKLKFISQISKGIIISYIYI